jgi:uncharacterized protein (DUF952 family)
VTKRPARVYHLALAAEWAEATDRGQPYRRSTLGKSLDEEGFIHCSLATQVQEVADLLYFGRDDVVLLTIDTALVPSDVVVENLHGTDQSYPHIYGPLPLEAVVHAVAVPQASDGRLDINGVLDWPQQGR